MWGDLQWRIIRQKYVRSRKYQSLFGIAAAVPVELQTHKMIPKIENVSSEEAQQWIDCNHFK